LVIRDINGFDPLTATTMVTVTVAGTGAIILPTQTLTLDRGVTLALSNNNLTLLGDTADNGGGATLLGPGKVTVGTAASEIVGGDYGWQAVGVNRVVINGTTPSIGGFDNTSTPAAATMIFAAKGLGATIKVTATSTALIVAAETEIALGGTYDKKWGEITLVGGTNAGTITFAVTTTSKITTANVAGATPVSGDLGTAGVTAVTGGTVTSIGITNVLGDGSDKTTAATTAVIDSVNNNLMPAGYLVSLTSAATNAPVKAGTAGNDGIISAATETNEDNT
jgi:hypothetical protein